MKRPSLLRHHGTLMMAHLQLPDKTTGAQIRIAASSLLGVGCVVKSWVTECSRKAPYREMRGFAVQEKHNLELWALQASSLHPRSHWSRYAAFPDVRSSPTMQILLHILYHISIVCINSMYIILYKQYCIAQHTNNLL